ncbi:MAG: hypothetical protein M9921_09610 [Fimbriimonadaceae bacterium]|nr:hypothetical protein [Fimbriimonadaceae bacterium]
MDINVLDRDRSRMELVGQFVEVRWTPGPLAEHRADQCVYLVRGHENDMLCLELVYRKKDGVHDHDGIFWVNVLAVQYMRVLSDREAQQRVEALEREVMEKHPRD